jgi:hypothetical protein
MITEAPTLNALWNRASVNVMLAPDDGILWDNLLTCSNLTAFDLDIGKDLWLTRNRFGKLQRDYLDADAFEAFLRRCADLQGSGTNTMLGAKPHDHTKAHIWGKHKWGNCFFGFSYRPHVLTLHSRTAFISSTGALDLALAYVIGKEINEILEVDQGPMKFVWHVDALQWHALWALPWMLARHIDETVAFEKPRNKMPPNLRQSRRNFDKLLQLWTDQVPLRETENSPGPALRLQKRFYMFMDQEPMESVPVDSLTLDSLRRK